MLGGCKLLTYPPGTCQLHIKEGTRTKNYCVKFECYCAGSQADKIECPFWSTAICLETIFDVMKKR